MPSAFVPGEPMGKARPRLGRNGRVYTPDATRKREQEIARLWWSPPIPIEIPVAVRVTAFYSRPKDHILSDGVSLSAKGKRGPVPMRTPDLDNVVKLALDALNGVAFRDDRQVQSVEATRWWAGDDGPGILIQVRALRPAELSGSSAP